MKRSIPICERNGTIYIHLFTVLILPLSDRRFTYLEKASKLDGFSPWGKASSIQPLHILHSLSLYKRPNHFSKNQGSHALQVCLFLRLCRKCMCCSLFFNIYIYIFHDFPWFSMVFLCWMPFHWRCDMVGGTVGDGVKSPQLSSTWRLEGIEGCNLGMQQLTL